MNAGETDQSRSVLPAGGVRPGTGGRIKVRPEDFLVDELPLIEPTGAGEHLWLAIEKRNATTAEIARALARHFRTAPRAVSFAGIKDKQAITRQVFSVHLPGRDQNSFSSFDHPNAGVLWAARHPSKIRQGQLAGNRFSIRIRDTDPTSVLRAKAVLDDLEARGLPNRFGLQRFGKRGNNHLIGRALWLGQWKEGLDLLLGSGPNTPAAQQESCDLYDAGQFEQALDALPRMLQQERTVLRALVRTGKPAKAWKAMRPRDRGFFISAMQSAIFNMVVDRRVADGTYDRALPGDVLLDDQQRNPIVLDAQTPLDPQLQQAVSRFERSASGPMWGCSMLRAQGAVDRAEVECLEAFGLSLETLAHPVDRAAEMTSGTRRNLRIPVLNCAVEGGVDEHGPYVRTAFDLPAGAFATEVMAVIMGRDSGATEDPS